MLSVDSLGILLKFVIKLHVNGTYSVFLQECCGKSIKALL